MKGRKPKPHYLKVVRGTARPGRPKGVEAAMPKQIPAPPSFLSADARREWRRLAPSLWRAGLLTAVDRAVFAAYCQSYGRWQQAEKMLAEAGAFTTQTTGGNTVQVAILGAARRAMGDTVRYGAEFGLSPSSRSRVTGTPPVLAADPAAEYFDVD